MEDAAKQHDASNGDPPLNQQTDAADARDPVEVLAESFLAEYRGGNRPSPEEYIARHPQYADQIRELFPRLLTIERLKPKNRVAAKDPPRIERLGDFRIVRLIGQGGMGVVYEAQQESLSRRVALKILSPAYLPTTALIERFKREAHAAARLHHTNIVPIFGVGEQDGLHYYIMQLISGHGLDRVLRADTDPFGLRNNWGRIAEIGQQIAAALDYAHHMQTLHRDIKPANLIHDEKGTVWITDFGLAKHPLDDDLTNPGDAVGTLRYMAPEQLNGHADERTDIHGLGLTLFELLAWRPVFDQSGPSQLIRSISSEARPQLRQLNPTVPRDLETIVLKAIAKDPQDRYSSALAMAEDLQRFRDGNPVTARRISASERLWRWSKRNPAIVRLTALAVILSLAITLMASVGYVTNQAALVRERQQAQRVSLARQQAELERERAESNLKLAMSAFDEIIEHYGFAEPFSADDTSAAASLPASAISPEVTEVLHKLLQFYEKFAAQNGDDEELASSLAACLRRMGDIHFRLGDLDLAVQAYQRALLTTTQLDGNDATVLAATIRNELALVKTRQAKFDEANTLLNAIEASAWNEPLPPAARRQLAKAALGRADIHHLQGRVGEWFASSEQAMSILEGLLRDDSADLEATFLLAIAYRNLPPRLDRDNYRQYVRRRLFDSIDLLEKLSRDYPDVPEYQHALCESYDRLRPQRDNGQPDWGPLPAGDRLMMSKLARGVQMCERLWRAHPGVPRYQDMLARMLIKLGRLRESEHDFDQAAELFRRAIEIEKNLVERVDSPPEFDRTLASARTSYAGRLIRDGRHETAAQTLRSAIAGMLAYRDAFPDHPRTAVDLAQMYELFAFALFEAGHAELAIEMQRLSNEWSDTAPAR